MLLLVLASRERKAGSAGNNGRWSLHLLPLSKSTRRLIDSAQARFLRRILKISAAYISRVSHVRVRQRWNTYRFSTFIFRAQLRWLGHILRKPENDPLWKFFFEPNSLCPPRPRSLTFRRYRRKRGRPHADWAGTFFFRETSYAIKYTRTKKRK